MKTTYEQISTPKTREVGPTGLVKKVNERREFHECTLPPMAEINAILRDEVEAKENFEYE